jgi:hypothetical protein
VVKDNFILLEFVERNVDERNDQFEYFIIEEPSTYNSARLLKQMQKRDMVVDDLIVNEPEFNLNQLLEFEQASGDRAYAEYYLEINTDINIDEEAKRLLRKQYEGKARTEGTTFLEQVLGRESKETPYIRKVDIYQSKVKPQDVKEKCE